MSEAARPLRVAVIGAGPAGIYTADILTKSEEVRTGAVEVAIDIFDPVSYTHLDVYKRQEISARPSQEARSAPIAGIKIGDAVMTKTLS